jgi:membrane associated rhomboid family serine protease
LLAGTVGGAYLKRLQEPRVPRSREPIFNIPAVIVGLLVMLAVIHVARMYLLTPRDDDALLSLFAFIPARYDASSRIATMLIGGLGAKIWSFVTYAFIHADVTHLGFNAIWLVAFGSPVARRFGTLRFLLFFVVTVAAGALAHLVTHFGEPVPVIGASAAISGTMAASIRFAFQPGGALDMWRARGGDPDHIPAAPLSVALRNPSVLAFLAVWFGLNILFGLGSISITGDAQNTAWEAHIGGFLAGLLLFSVFDPVGKHPKPAGDQTIV